MAALSRRGFLVGAAVALALARSQLRDAGRIATAAPLELDPFTLGVASGDPAPDSVVLWTRLAPVPLAGGGMPPEDVAVVWEMATDVGFTDVVASGTEPAVATLAHSVHAEAVGLEPDRWYHYRFHVDGFTSPVGRTRTTPAWPARTPLRLGAASCQNYRDGYYTAYTHLAAESCDLIAFLGDYIYEGGGSGPVRNHPGGEANTLVGYRDRYALYKTDPELQAAHAACPWVVVWDDHEVDNNYAGAFSQDGVDPVAFLARRAEAYQAWYEHQPVRLDPPTGPDLAIHRSLDWGSLARIHLLDTRQHRSDQACGDALKQPCDGWDDPTRTLLGDGQEAWLLDGLHPDGTVWDVVAQQIVFAPMPIGKSINMDQWDGYPAQRDRVWSALRQCPNPLVLSGDIHLAAEVVLHDQLDDATTTRRGTELVTGSISSRFNATDPGLMKVVLESIDWWDWANAGSRGYVVVDLTEQSLQARVRLVSTTEQTTATVRTARIVQTDAVPVSLPPSPPPTTTSTSTSTSTTTTVASSTTPSTAGPMVDGATGSMTTLPGTPTVGADGGGAVPATRPVRARPRYTG